MRLLQHWSPRSLSRRHLENFTEMIFFVLLLFFALSNAFSTNDLIDVQWNVFKVSETLFTKFRGEEVKSCFKEIVFGSSFGFYKKNVVVLRRFVNFKRTSVFQATMLCKSCVVTESESLKHSGFPNLKFNLII